MKHNTRLTPEFDVEKMKRYVEGDTFFEFVRTQGWAKDLPLEKALLVYFNSEVIGNSVAEEMYMDT
jgi:hypothetical protein